jgi:hypothetical protein
MLGKNIGTILVIGGLVAIAIVTLKRFEFDTEAEFKVGDYRTELGFDFGLDKRHRKGKRRGRDRPNLVQQPNQIDEESPRLISENVDIDMYPYYNRAILW